MSRQAEPPLDDEWEVASRTDESFELVTLAFVDFAEIDESWSPDERASLDARVSQLLHDPDVWDEPGWPSARGEPVNLVYECNWRDTTGEWHRMVHGVNAGRHRLVAAQRVNRPTIWAKVAERLFFPPDERPPDRATLPPSSERRVLDPRDHPNPMHAVGRLAKQPGPRW